MEQVHIEIMLQPQMRSMSVYHRFYQYHSARQNVQYTVHYVQYTMYWHVSIACTYILFACITIRQDMLYLHVQCSQVGQVGKNAEVE